MAANRIFSFLTVESNQLSYTNRMGRISLKIDLLESRVKVEDGPENILFSLYFFSRLS